MAHREGNLIISWLFRHFNESECLCYCSQITYTKNRLRAEHNILTDANLVEKGGGFSLDLGFTALVSSETQRSDKAAQVSPCFSLSLSVFAVSPCFFSALFIFAVVAWVEPDYMTSYLVLQQRLAGGRGHLSKMLRKISGHHTCWSLGSPFLCVRPSCRQV